MKSALKNFTNPEELIVDEFDTHNLTLRFHELANILLNQCILKIGLQDYRISEIEFYVYSKEHQDKYTHCAATQKQYGQWYFHKKGKSFKGGNYKGLDLTLGDGENYLGVLIRRIKNYDTNITTDGPSLVVDKILEENKVKDISEFLASPKSVLEIIPQSKLDSLEFFMCPRHGLSTKGMKELSFQFIPWRYMTEPKNTKNGKALLYLHQYFLYGRDRVLERTGIREADAIKYEKRAHACENISFEEAVKISKKDMCEIFAFYLSNREN